MAEAASDHSSPGREIVSRTGAIAETPENLTRIFLGPEHRHLVQRGGIDVHAVAGPNRWASDRLIHSAIVEMVSK